MSAPTRWARPRCPTLFGINLGGGSTATVSDNLISGNGYGVYRLLWCGVHGCHRVRTTWSAPTAPVPPPSRTPPTASTRAGNERLRRGHGDRQHCSAAITDTGVAFAERHRDGVGQRDRHRLPPAQACGRALATMTPASTLGSFLVGHDDRQHHLRQWQLRCSTSMTPSPLRVTLAGNRSAPTPLGTPRSRTSAARGIVSLRQP